MTKIQALKYRIIDSVIHIEMPCGKVCLLDEDDLWILDKFSLGKTRGHVSAWRFLEVEHGTAYQRMYLHRLVCKLHPRDKFSVDHINRNGFDNRKSNLRFAGRFENARNVGPKINNKLSLKGVLKRSHNKLNPYGAFFKFGGSNNLGYFKTPEEAGIVYDINSLVHHGEFAYLNYPEKINEYREKISTMGMDSSHVYIKRKDIGLHIKKIQ